MERIALVSDVHGNLTALEAVLADIDRRGISRVFNLGDYVGKGPRGREVVAATNPQSATASTTLSTTRDRSRRSTAPEARAVASACG